MIFIFIILAAYHATVHPKGVKVKVGERVQFVCVASGFGQNYTIKWYNSNNSDNPLVTINHSHVLDIPLAQLNNSGSYYCVVKNEFAEFVSNISPLQVIGTYYSRLYACVEAWRAYNIVCMYTCMYMCACMCVYAYGCVCVYVCLYVCV